MQCRGGVQIVRTWDLWLCIIVYTITFFWFGLWVQKRYDQYQLKAFEDAAFTDGCKKCAQFEKLECQRDQLQGVPKHKEIPQ
jgi:ABC-type maltose transport system permease subunit